MSQLSDENISQWIQIFANAYAQNPDGMNFTEDIFSENMKKDLPLFMSICNKILLVEDESDEKVKISKEMSSNFLYKILKYENLSELNEKRSLISKEMTEQMKESFKQNIFSEHDEIRNFCIKNYSLLFSILTTNWKEGIDEIINSIANTNFLPYGTIVFLSIMKEIMKAKNFLTEILSTFSEPYTQIFVFSIEILAKEQNESNYIPELRLEACKYIYEFVAVYPEILNENGDDEKVQYGAKIPAILELLPNSFQIDDFDLFKSLTDLLNLFVEKFYSNSLDFMETITQYISNGFDLISVNQKYTSLSINFWLNVAKFEGEIIEICRCSNNPEKEIQPLKPLLSEIASKPLIQFFINFVESIDDNDVKVENKERSDVHKIIVSTIKSIYKIVPEIFEMIKEVVDEEISKEKWTNIYSGIILLYTICGEPFDSDVGTFILSKIEFLIQNSIPDQIPRIRYNSLLVIGVVFQNYPQLILEQNYDILINQLIEIFEATLQFDEKQQLNISEDNCSIFERYANIIYSISTLWYSTSNEDSKLHLYFDRFYKIINTLIKYGIKNKFNNLIEKSSEALNRMISFSTPEMLSTISNLYEKTLDELLQLKNSLIEEEETFSIAASFYCSNLTTILLELKNNDEIISQYSEQTIQVLFEILEVKNEKLWKEIFWTIASLIIASASKNIDVFTPYTFNILYEQFIETAFTSDNPELIRSTSCLLSSIYSFLFKKMLSLYQLIPDVFEVLIFFLNEKEMKDAYPFILDGVSSIFLNIDQKDENIEQLESTLYETILKLIDVSNYIDITNENEIEYNNLFYQYMCNVIRNYAKIFYCNNDDKHEKEQLLLIDKLAFYVGKLIPKITDDLFKAFVLVVNEFASKCSKKNFNALKNKSIHIIFESGFENCSQQDLCEQMKEVDDFINGNE